MSKESKVPCDDSNNFNIFNWMHVERVESALWWSNNCYSCELNDSKSESDEVDTLELPLVIFIILSTMWCNLKVFGMGRLDPNLSFFGGGCDAVVILVEGCDSLVGGRGRLGVEKRVGVSFIRAEAATEAMVVSMDSSSKSSISNESTRETSLLTSAMVLKETSLIV